MTTVLSPKCVFFADFRANSINYLEGNLTTSKNFKDRFRPFFAKKWENSGLYGSTSKKWEESIIGSWRALLIISSDLCSKERKAGARRYHLRAALASVVCSQNLGAESQFAPAPNLAKNWKVGLHSLKFDSFLSLCSESLVDEEET